MPSGGVAVAVVAHGVSRASPSLHPQCQRASMRAPTAVAPTSRAPCLVHNGPIMPRALHTGTGVTSAAGDGGGDNATHAVLFDIDGVLLRGNGPLPGAKETLQRLQDAGTPFAMLTNGGGTPEAEKAAKVSKILGFEIPEDRIILAHSPMRALVPAYKDKLVLVVGKARAKAIATAYGFQHVMTVDDLHASHPNAFPDRAPVSDATHAGYHDETQRVAAVMGFLDPADYHRDLQVRGHVSLCQHKVTIATDRSPPCRVVHARVPPPACNRRLAVRWARGNGS